MIEDVDPHITVVESQCQVCAHWDKNRPTLCAAFPDGIPLVIFFNRYDHTAPYMDESGEVLDHGLRWEPNES